jgi:hypothetical protein
MSPRIFSQKVVLGSKLRHRYVPPRDKTLRAKVLKGYIAKRRGEKEGNEKRKRTLNKAVISF